MTPTTIIRFGPLSVTDLKPIAPGSNIGVDQHTDDELIYDTTTIDIIAAVHGGDDLVRTGSGNDTIYDDPSLSLTANPIPGVTFNPFSGDDYMSAGAGNNTIYAGDGRNTYEGG